MTTTITTTIKTNAATPTANRQTQRTRAALVKAFIELVLSEGFEKLTVEQIATRANVGRSTFYLHFAGRDDILKATMMHPSEPLARIVGEDLDASELVPILTHFIEQKSRNRVFFKEPVRRIWADKLAEMIEVRLIRLVATHVKPTTLPLPLIAIAIADAQISLVTRWLTSKQIAKPEAVAAALIASTHGQVAALMFGRSDVRLLIDPQRPGKVVAAPIAS
jgi:AcrR family transcriptional regulator